MTSSNVGNLVRSVVLIATGEYSYSVSFQIHPEGYAVNSHEPDGKKTDIELTIEQLKINFPNIQVIAIEVPWFADSTKLENNKILPRIEDKNNILKWRVAEFTRDNATELSKDKKSFPNYGGTPSDESLIELCDRLRIDGYKIALFPKIYVDDQQKSWGGMIKSSASIKKMNYETAKFFNDKDYGYNKFIKHYAELLKDKLDIISLGSELKALTLSINQYGQSPAVKELAFLAKDVREIVGDKVKITYIANYGEYHHSDKGNYPLDRLWGDNNIDIVTINANFPLGDDLTSCLRVKRAWNSGEGYDYYLSGNKKVDFKVPTWAWKNFKYWYEKAHYEDQQQTLWNPDEKKELNVIYDPKANPIVIAGSEAFFKEQGIVTNAFLYYFDSRPYPYYSDKYCQYWSDCTEWMTKSTVNGKIDNSYIDLQGCFDSPEL